MGFVIRLVVFVIPILFILLLFIEYRKNKKMTNDKWHDDWSAEKGNIKKEKADKKSASEKKWKDNFKDQNYN